MGLEKGVEKLLVMLLPLCVVRLMCILIWLLVCGVGSCGLWVFLFVGGVYEVEFWADDSGM